MGRCLRRPLPPRSRDQSFLLRRIELQCVGQDLDRAGSGSPAISSFEGTYRLNAQAAAPGELFLGEVRSRAVAPEKKAEPHLAGHDPP
jgi:hypothetical protein